LDKKKEIDFSISPLFKNKTEVYINMSFILDQFVLGIARVAVFLGVTNVLLFDVDTVFRESAFFAVVLFWLVSPACTANTILKIQIKNIDLKYIVIKP
jgi:hypothetical protein